MADNEGTLSLEEVQKLVLDVMKSFHVYCEKHHLRYCLLCGTLLGAIRHRGFIPWDDDIDIVMSRDDYEKLKVLVKEDPIAPFVHFVDYQTYPGFHYVISRVCHSETQVSLDYLIDPIDEMGLWVDIFPLDGYNPLVFLIQKPLLWINNMLCNINNYQVPPTGPLWKRAVQKTVLKCFPDRNNKYEKRIDRISKWVKYSKSRRVIMVSDLDHPEDEIIPRTDLEQAVPAPFEDTEFYIPQNADRILRNIYGDYMILPPENQRIPHGCIARMRKEDMRSSSV